MTSPEAALNFATLPAGKATDAMVALRVMGWTSRQHVDGLQVHTLFTPLNGIETHLVPAYSTNIAHAWEVMIVLAIAGHPVAVRFNLSPDIANNFAPAGSWTAGVLISRDYGIRLSEATGDTVYYLEWNGESTAYTPALAICRTALRSVTL